MNIIFLEAVHNFGGARKSTLELAHVLQQQGHKVLLVDFWGCCRPFNEAVKKEDLNFKILDKRKNPFILGHKNKLTHLAKALKYAFIQRRYKKEFAKIVKQFQPDVVGVNSLKCLNILDKQAGYTIDFYARGWYRSQELSIFFKRKLKRYRPRFVAISQATKQALVAGGFAKPEAVSVCGPVITKAFLADNRLEKPTVFSKENPIKILHAAGFHPAKGQHVSLEVAQELKAMHLPFKLTLAGIIYADQSSKIYFEQIKKSIREKNLENDVEVIPNKTEITAHFKATDMLIHPSATEGLGRVVLEAMAFAKPVVANPAGGITDLVKHHKTGYLTAFDAVDQYVYYIKKYIAHPELLNQHGQSGRALVENKYTEENQRAVLQKLYPKK